MLITLNKALILKYFGSLFLLLIIDGGIGLAALADPGKFLEKLPSLDQALDMASGHYGEGVSSKQPGKNSRADVFYEVKRNYSLILVRREQLEILKEVQNHFEEAISGAEKKFEKETEDISQSAITKLKLGLAGTLNDIAKYKTDIQLAKLNLEDLLGVQWAENLDISEPPFKPVDFPYKSVEEYLKGMHTTASPETVDNLMILKKGMIEINLAREQLDLGRKNRRMTRALLVAEVANYDFGIGNEADLFEALIIYTRVLVGYYETVHNFNLSVYRLTRSYVAP